MYNFLELETNKGEFSIYFKLFEKKVVGGATTITNIKNKHKNHYIFTMDAPPGVPWVSK
jgi:hypothetical protein